jgi:hypothetical protein
MIEAGVLVYQVSRFLISLTRTQFGSYQLPVVVEKETCRMERRRFIKSMEELIKSLLLLFGK